MTLLKLTDVAALPWDEQPERVFDGAPAKARLGCRRGQLDMRVKRRVQFDLGLSCFRRSFRGARRLTETSNGKPTDQTPKRGVDQKDNTWGDVRRSARKQ